MEVKHFQKCQKVSYTGLERERHLIKFKKKKKGLKADSSHEVKNKKIVKKKKKWC